VPPGPCKVCSSPDAKFICEFCEERVCANHVASVESGENVWLQEKYGLLRLEASALCAECIETLRSTSWKDAVAN
jgi:hypothetical protein